MSADRRRRGLGRLVFKSTPSLRLNLRAIGSLPLQRNRLRKLKKSTMGSFGKQSTEKDHGMTSERQAAANRRNAQLSTGPRTPEGREISSRNSQQHGVLSQRVTTDVEGNEIYERMLSSFMDEYGPRSETELLLVERLANLFWRERRLIQTERSQLSSQQSDIYAVSLAKDQSLTLTDQLLIGRYQTMLTNQINITIAQIERLMQREASE
jgi:hypothetical protein